MATEIIDIEPTWESICNMVSRGFAKADVLMPACKIADVIRQAQKKGVKRLIITFGDDSVTIDSVTIDEDKG